jgi:hypothetical protein
MRNQHPSRQWLRCFEAEFVNAGGWGGPATLRVVTEKHAHRFYLMGATPKVAGTAAADIYGLHRELDRRIEEAATSFGPFGKDA